MSSAKMQFMTKLRTHESAPRAFESRIQADVAAFTQRMAQLQSSMSAWLEGTGIDIEATDGQFTDLLAGPERLRVPGILLRYRERAIAFAPLFLYGHGVTGCVEVGLRAEGKNIPLRRLFMRSGTQNGWVCTRNSSVSASPIPFDEEAFFAMLSPLLPG